MKHLKVLAIGLAALAALVGCKSQYELLLESNDTDAKYEAAFNYFNQGKYNRAAALFESLTLVTSGTSKDDTVQYYWGLSNYNFKDYYTAETNFDNFLGNYPRSPFAESAKYLRIDCLYRSTLNWQLDQTPSYKAMSSIGEYLMEFPDGPNSAVARHMLDDLGERLDKKAFENARIYYTMEDYKAARVALKNVLKDDADNIYREEILYYATMSSYKYANLSYEEKKKERFLVFYDDYLNFVGEYPESSHRKELDQLYGKVKEKY